MQNRVPLEILNLNSCQQLMLSSLTYSNQNAIHSTLTLTLARNYSNCFNTEQAFRDTRAWQRHSQDRVMTHEIWKLKTRVKTSHTSVETEPRDMKEPCLETVSRQDACLETPSPFTGTSQSTFNRSLRRRSSQPISWLSTRETKHNESTFCRNTKIPQHKINNKKLKPSWSPCMAVWSWNEAGPMLDSDSAAADHCTRL